MENKKTKLQKVSLVAGGIFFLLCMICSLLRLNASFENKVYDLFMKLRPMQSPPPDLIYLKIDEEIKEEGFWPWGKHWLGYLINFLSGTGIKAIGIDSSLARFASHLRNDHLLKAAESRVPVIYPLQAPFLATKDSELVLDSDKKVRRFVLFSQTQGKISFSLALRLALFYLGATEQDLSFTQNKKLEIRSPSSKKRSVPLLQGGQVLINYHRWDKPGIKEYTYLDVVFSAFLLSRREKPTVNFDEFKNKILILGMCPKIIKENYITPLKTNCPALEIQLNVLSNIIENNFVRKLKSEGNLLILVICIVVSFFAFLRIGLGKRCIYLVLFISLYLLISFILFSYPGIWVDTFLPSWAMFISFWGVSMYRWGQEWENKLENRRRELARRLKIESLSKNIFSTDKLEIIIKKTSPKEAEGDFYDIMELDNERLAVIIGKAPGKNLNTVNYIIKTLNEFRLQAPLHKRPRAVLNAVNNALFPDGAGGMYATCIYFEIDTSRGLLSFANAGEEPFILVREGQTALETYEATNPTPLGIAKNVLFTDQTFALNRGDFLMAFTAGIVGLRNKSGGEFGIERLQEVVSHYRSWDIAKLANKVFEKVHRFSDGQDLSCECSVLLIRVKTNFKTAEAIVNGKRKEVIQSN
jgi:CHASE2 domain-containing sensor protein